MSVPVPSAARITHEMTTTAFGLAGYRVVRDFGVVMGITVRSRSIFGLIGASGLFVELCNKARAEAFELMLEHAEQHGANAVIGIRYDANEIMQGVTEVLCYGSGVLVEPE
jgi:uncharacterized protein YbjQ (UPF0145 family)